MACTLANAPVPHTAVAGVEMKLCRGCGNTKPLDEFHHEARSPDGHSPHCKTCVTSANMFARHRQRETKLKTLAGQLSARLARRHEDPITPDEAIIRHAIRVCGGEAEVGRIMGQMIMSEDVKPGVKRMFIKDLLDGAQRLERRKLERRQLDKMESGDLIHELLTVLSDSVGGDLVIDEAIEEQAAEVAPELEVTSADNPEDTPRALPHSLPAHSLPAHSLAAHPFATPPQELEEVSA